MRRIAATAAAMLALHGGDARGDGECPDDYDCKLWVVSAPTTAGVAYSGGSWGFATGLRPSLVRATYGFESGWGAGLYGDLALTYSGPNQGWLGGGATWIYYSRKGPSVALSAGVAHGGASGLQPAVGAFVGLRLPELAELFTVPIDLPLGIRVDLRGGLDGTPSTVAVQVEIDLLAIVYVFAEAEIGRRRDGRE